MPRGGFRPGGGRPKGSKDTKVRVRKVGLYKLKTQKIVRVPYPQSCALCGEGYTAWRKKKYCSRVCASIVYYQRTKHLRKKEPSQKICAHCGKTYTGSRSKYCSQECLLAASQKIQRSYPHVCPTCGENFEGQKKQGYCSYECFHQMNFRTLLGGEIEKRCTVCGEWKPLNSEYYHKDNSRDKEFSSYCKLCSTKKSTARQKTERGKQLKKESNIRNIETIRAYRRKVQPILNERAKIRSRTDPAFQLNRRMRRLIWGGLREAKGGQSWQDLAGYSIDTLRRHIEKQFLPGMTWECFLAGEIHIDHKIPRAAFNYSRPEDPDFKKCWALNNLQPLWALDNLKKSDNIEKPFQPSLAIGA
jgi:hypothetical protein